MTIECHDFSFDCAMGGLFHFQKVKKEDIDLERWKEVMEQIQKISVPQKVIDEFIVEFPTDDDRYFYSFQSPIIIGLFCYPRIQIPLPSNVLSLKSFTEPSLEPLHGKAVAPYLRFVSRLL